MKTSNGTLTLDFKVVVGIDPVPFMWYPACDVIEGMHPHDDLHRYNEIRLNQLLEENGEF